MRIYLSIIVVFVLFISGNAAVTAEKVGLEKPVLVTAGNYVSLYVSDLKAQYFKDYKTNQLNNVLCEYEGSKVTIHYIFMPASLFQSALGKSVPISRYVNTIKSFNRDLRVFLDRETWGKEVVVEYKTYFTNNGKDQHPLDLSKYMDEHKDVR
ncbi:MAG: hypothetical protein A2293_00375 [Elusimicrobia bacterium RIFOXYB2_FULL_49_7]|nr:MAG: hypothetical protein A2293_00375 [Elusimicrobia bacterium RIFOXYB2_FULL_49_7]